MNSHMSNLLTEMSECKYEKTNRAGSYIESPAMIRTFDCWNYESTRVKDWTFTAYPLFFIQREDGVEVYLKV